MLYRRRTITTLLIVATLLCGAYFLPTYHPGVSGGPHDSSGVPSAASSALSPLAEIAAVSPTAPIALLTEPDDGVAAVHAAIAQASTSLDLVVYELEDTNIAQELAAASARGVAVRVLLQNVNTFGRHPNQPAFDFLKAHGVPVAWASREFALTHQKTLIIDAAEPSLARALIMTFNLASQYYASGRDFGILDGDSRDVAAISAVFDADWNAAARGNARGSAASSDVSSPPDANADDLVWSPGSAPTLLALIDSASTTLDVYNEEMADPRITAALERAAARGVAVRIVMTYATNWKPAFTELAAAGVALHTFSSSGKLYIHAKMILADDVRAFLGSENFSQPSLDRNRELGILIARPDILTSLEKTFNRDWAASRPFHL